MTPLQQLVKIFGDRPKLAKAIGTSNGTVDHWLRPKSPFIRDTLPAKYNAPLLNWVAENDPARFDEVKALLVMCCPHCQRPY